jgi:hypothetical protein
VGSWVYAWIDRAGDAEVVYVGATGLHPATRAWLHLHDPDPDVGRIAARFGREAVPPLDVLAMRVPEGIARADVRDALAARLADEGLLPPRAVADWPRPLVPPAAECGELVDRFVARLRTDLERGSTQVL